MKMLLISAVLAAVLSAALLSQVVRATEAPGREPLYEEGAGQ
jgi:hypothetical protein